MAQIGDVIANARTLAKADTNSLPDATAILYANVALSDWYKKLLERREDFFIQESYRDITSAEIVGGSQPGKFLLPQDNILIKSLEVNTQDSTNVNLYYEAQIVDPSNLPQGMVWEERRTNQDIGSPLYSWFGDWIEIVPTPTVTMAKGLRLFYFLLPHAFAGLTDVVQYPYYTDTVALAYRIVSEYYKTTNSELALYYEKKYDEAVEKMIQMFGDGEQKPIKVQGLPLTGYEF